MNESTPRYEFRAFAQDFGLVTERIRGRGGRPDVAESLEHYLVSRGGMGHNVKIRQGSLEMKRLLRRAGTLEQWQPCAREALPVSPRVVRSLLVPALGLAPVRPDRARYSLEDLRESLDGLVVARVCKRRFRFTLGGCPAELDELLVNGAAIRSVAVESEDPQAVRALIGELGLAGYENVAYSRAIRRIVGLEPLPERAWHRTAGQ